MLLFKKEDIASLRKQLEDIRQQGARYFLLAMPTKDHSNPWENSWEIKNDDTRNEAEALRTVT